MVRARSTWLIDDYEGKVNYDRSPSAGQVNNPRRPAGEPIPAPSGPRRQVFGEPFNVARAALPRRPATVPGTPGRSQVEKVQMLDHVVMARLVEIHVPLPAGAVEELSEEEHPIVWIEVIEEFLEELDTAGEIEVFDDGEEYGDVYIFFISGADEKTLLAAASRVAVLDAVPAGTFAMVTDDEAEEFGMGRRVDLPVS